MDTPQHSDKREQISDDHTAAPECLPVAGESSSHAIKFPRSGLCMSDECHLRGWGGGGVTLISSSWAVITHRGES